MTHVRVAKAMLVGVGLSYGVSAGALALGRRRGVPVPRSTIAGWLAAGVAGTALALWLAPGRRRVWEAEGVVLTPWLVYALVGDWRHRNWAIAAADASGLAALGTALALSAEDALAA